MAFEVSSDNWGDHRVHVDAAPGPFGEGGRELISVPTARLDEIAALRDAATPLLWMDIQGYEGHALGGAGNLLSRRVPIALEFWPYGMRRANSFGPLLDRIGGYAGFHVLDSPADGLHPLSDLEALHDRLGPDGAFTDILVI